MFARIAYEVVGVTLVRCGHREAKQATITWSHTAFDCAAKVVRDYLVLHSPMVSGRFGIDDQICEADSVDPRRVVGGTRNGAGRDEGSLPALGASAGKGKGDD